MVVQYKALSLMFFDIDEGEMVHYIHSWSPVLDYDEYEIRGNYVFFRIDESYVAVYFSEKFSLTEKGINAFKEIISKGLRHFIAVRASDKREAGSFEDFKRKMLSTPISYDLEKHIATVEDFSYGKVSITESETTINGIRRPDEWDDDMTREQY